MHLAFNIPSIFTACSRSALAVYGTNTEGNKAFFAEGARAALGYSQNQQMTDTVVEAPKMFREMDGVKLKNVQLPNALETL